MELGLERGSGCSLEAFLLWHCMSISALAGGHGKGPQDEELQNPVGSMTHHQNPAGNCTGGSRGMEGSRCALGRVFGSGTPFPGIKMTPPHLLMHTSLQL